MHWFSGLYCCLTRSVALNLGPWSFTRTVFVRIKLQFLPTVQRNIGQELSGAVCVCVCVCGVFICVSSNKLPTCCERSPPAARCFRLHRL